MTRPQPVDQATLDARRLLKLGMFMMPLHPPDKVLASSLNEDREAIILADRLGFSEAWCGEHFSSVAEPIPSPLMLFSSVIHETRQIKFATGVLNLPQIHPAMAAAHVAMFDHMSGGRYLMGIGPGGLGSDFEMVGLDDRQQRDEMVRESIDIIRRIWSQDPPYDIRGKYWSVTIENFIYPELGIGTMLKPLQTPHPPICMSIVTPNSSSARFAGANGFLPVSANFIQPRYIRSHWSAYAEGVESVGERPDPSRWRIARSVLVTGSDDEAEDYLASPDCGLHFYYEYFRRMYLDRGALDMLKPDEKMSDEETTTPVVARSMTTWGSVGTALDELVALADEWGPFGTLLMVGHDWDRPKLWQRSMRLLADEVMPRLSQHVSALAEKRIYQ